MTSASPGLGTAPPPGAMEPGPVGPALSMEDELFLGTQRELAAWTKPLPGENDAMTNARREKVMRLIEVVAEV